MSIIALTYQAASDSLSRLTLSEKVDIANGIVALASAGVAFWAVLLAIRENSESRSERRLERATDLYSRVVLDPVGAALSVFVREAGEELDKRRRAIAELNSSLLSHAAVLQECKAAADAFNTSFFIVRGLVRGPMIAWNDDRLATEINEATQQLQDNVIREINSLGTNGPHQSSLVVPLSEGVARVLQTLVSYDVTSKSTARPAVRPKSA